MPVALSVTDVRTIARVVYEGQRSLRRAVGERPTLPGWFQLPRDQRRNVEAVVRGVAAGTIVTPLDLHARWAARKLAAGWSLGPADASARTHPHLVEFDALPEALQLRYYLAFTTAQCLVTGFALIHRQRES